MKDFKVILFFALMGALVYLSTTDTIAGEHMRELARTLFPLLGSS